MTLQSDPGWLHERQGKLGASRVKDALNVLKNGKPSESRRKLMMELVAERMTGASVDNLVTADMRRGLELEPEAIALYEATYGVMVLPAAWVPHPTIDNTGATPDSFVGSDGLLEIKAPRQNRLIEWARAEGVPDEHRLQLIWQQVCTGRQWTDFCAYCPDMPEGKQILVRRFIADEEEREETAEKVIEFLAETDALFDQVTQMEFN